MTTKPDFLADLRSRIREHVIQVQSVFLELDDAQLVWRPNPSEWNVLQCFDHLNLTNDYYMSKIAGGLSNPRPANGADDTYAPSFWGRIYMHFSFNPKYSFPAPSAVVPAAGSLDRGVLHRYLARQDALLKTLDAVGPVDLRATTVPVEKFVRFNLGDCLKILVYHDRLHMGQAERVLQAMRGNAA
jgi:hypothetical protein